MTIKTDSEILRIEKRIRGLNTVAASINNLSIYGIFYGNYPELVKVLEHAKDHAKEELKKSKNMLEYINQDVLEEPQEASRNEVNEAYLDKRI